MVKDLREKIEEICTRTSNKQVIEVARVCAEIPERYKDTVAEPALHLVKILDLYNRSNPRGLLLEVNDFCETITPIMHRLIVGGSVPQTHWGTVNAIFQKLKGKDDSAAGSAKVAASTLQALYNVRSLKGAHKPKVQPEEFDMKFCTLGALYAFREHLRFLLYAGQISRGDSKKINDLQVLSKEIADRLVRVPVKPPSLAGLIKKHRIQTHLDKFLTIVWYMSKYEGIGTVNVRDIIKAYRRKIKQAMPKNPDDLLNKLIGRGFLEEAGVKEGLRFFSITLEGEEKVKQLLRRSF